MNKKIYTEWRKKPNRKRFVSEFLAEVLASKNHAGPRPRKKLLATGLDKDLSDEADFSSVIDEDEGGCESAIRLNSASRNSRSLNNEFIQLIYCVIEQKKKLLLVMQVPPFALSSTAKAPLTRRHAARNTKAKELTDNTNAAALASNNEA
uniref:Tantalus-like domain-containing protein n=1 Tax=Romanomermis culicivorax TaxID=13658 RepID=A0A915KE18_ROMCU